MDFFGTLLDHSTPCHRTNLSPICKHCHLAFITILLLDKERDYFPFSNPRAVWSLDKAPAKMAKTTFLKSYLTEKFSTRGQNKTLSLHFVRKICASEIRISGWALSLTVTFLSPFGRMRSASHLTTKQTLFCWGKTHHAGQCRRVAINSAFCETQRDFLRL